MPPARLSGSNRRGRAARSSRSAAPARRRRDRASPRLAAKQSAASAPAMRERARARELERGGELVGASRKLIPSNGLT
eukprot:6201546-Pleurochrysis_carterae.AAC.2